MATPPPLPLIFILLTLSLTTYALDTPFTTPSPPENVGTDSLCWQFLEELFNKSYHGENMTVEKETCMALSGHNLNDLGYYKTCLRATTQKYYVLFVENNKAGIGFCGPSFCSAVQLQNYTDKLNAILTNITRSDLSAYKVKVVDPQDYIIEDGFWFYFTILLGAIILVLTAVGSVNWYRNSAKPIVYEGPKRLQPSQDSTISNQKIKDLFGVNKESIQIKQKEEPPLARPKKPRRKPAFLLIAECFNLAENFNDLLKDEKDPRHDQNLNCFNGIRVFAFFWVVYGHVFLLSTGAKNYDYVSMFINSPWALLVVAAFYAVDTFFYLSGFLTGFLMIGKLSKMRMSFKNYGLIMMARLIRLWPTYFIIILFYWKIGVYFGDGPLWYNYVEQAQYCSYSAWKNWLLMDNVLAENTEYACFGWGWYLACDMQVFLLAPIICWVYIKNREKSHTLIWFLMTVSVVTGYIYAADGNYTYTLLSMGHTNEHYMAGYYTNPMVRMSPYLVGLFIGFLFKEYKDGARNIFSQLRDNKRMCYVFATGGFLGLVFLVFYPRTIQDGNTWSNGFAESWSIFGRPLWALALFCLTAPILVGNLKSLGGFLSNYFFTVIARLSYSGYLVHLMVLEMVFWGSDQYFGLSQKNQGGMAISFCLLATGAALILYLLVEKPLANVDAKFITGAGRARKPRESPVKAEEKPRAKEVREPVVSQKTYQKVDV